METFLIVLENILLSSTFPWNLSTVIKYFPYEVMLCGNSGFTVMFILGNPNYALKTDGGKFSKIY